MFTVMGITSPGNPRSPKDDTVTVDRKDAPAGYDAWLAELKIGIREAQLRASLAVNTDVSAQSKQTDRVACAAWANLLASGRLEDRQLSGPRRLTTQAGHRAPVVASWQASFSAPTAAPVFLRVPSLTQRGA